MKFNHSFKLVSTDVNTRNYICSGTEAKIDILNESCIRVRLRKTDTVNDLQPKESETDAFGFGDITVKISLKNFLISYYKNGSRLFIV